MPNLGSSSNIGSYSTNAGSEGVFFAPSALGGYYGAAITGGVRRNLNPNITSGGWRHYIRNGRRGPNSAIPGNLYSYIKYWQNVVPYDFYYVSTNNGYPGAQAGDVIKWIKDGIEGTNDRVTKFPGANNKKVNLVWTGSHPDNISAQLGSGKWFDNLLVDSTDGIGNIESIAFDNTELSNILVQNQPEFQVLQSDKIQTSVNKSSNTNVQINASKKFKAMHGNGIDYTYTDS